MKFTVSAAFERDLKRQTRQDALKVIAALEQFGANPNAGGLNFEPVTSRAGYFTIRANRPVRVLLRRLAADHYEAVAVGNHDYVYRSYFK